jgi:transposase-like protein
MAEGKRAYSEEEKEATIALVVDGGLAAAWRATGIPKTTIAGWCKAAGVRTYGGEKTAAATEAAVEQQTLRREQLRTMLLEKAVDLLERMDSPHIEFKGKDADQVEYPIAPAGAVQNYATSVGILIDKYRLELGEATGRNETRTLTDGLADHEKQALRDAIDRILHPVKA